MPRVVRTTLAVPRARGAARAFSGGPTPGPTCEPAGFTLVEILVAIGLLVAVVSLVAPVLVSRIAPATFDGTLERFAGELRLAREDARRTGSLVYIYAESGERELRIVARRTPVESTADLDAFAGFPLGNDAGLADGGSRFPGASQVGGASAFSGDAGGAFDGEDRPRLLFVMPEGFRVTHTAPMLAEDLEGVGALVDGTESAALAEIGGVDPESVADGESAFDPFGSESESDLAESRLIAVCVPDGTVLLARPTWVVDRDDRTAALRINRASGVISFERVEPRSEDFADPFADTGDDTMIGGEPLTAPSRRTPGRSFPERGRGVDGGRP